MNPTDEHREQAREIIEAYKQRITQLPPADGEVVPCARWLEFRLALALSRGRGLEVSGATKRLFAVVGEDGALWATFDTREKAERYPGPRMLELAPRRIVEYVPISALSSRDAEVKQVLEGLRFRHGCWCELPPNAGSPDHTNACLAARDLYSKLQATELRSENPGANVDE